MPVAFMKMWFSMLLCLLTACIAAAAKLKTHGASESVALPATPLKAWCDRNVYPFPTAKYSAEGKSKYGGVITDQDLQALRNVLKDEPSWKIGKPWEFKAKVLNSFTKNLEFAFPGAGNRTYFKLNVPAASAFDELSVKDLVGQPADFVQLQYFGEDPAKILAQDVTFTDLCLRPLSCENFGGCTPWYHYRKKPENAGDTMADCCEPLRCKETVPGGCSPTTQWKQYSDFETRLGASEDYCCIPRLCSDTDVCSNSTTLKPKDGTGIRGSTVEECCDEVYCSDDHGLCGDLPRLNDTYANGSYRLGSTLEQCCHLSTCAETIDCADESQGTWAFNETKSKQMGFSRADCCDPVYCHSTDICNGTKFAPKYMSNLTIQANTVEACCEPLYCRDYTCKNGNAKLPGNLRQGSTDEECCDDSWCRDYTCSSRTKWTKLPDIENTDDGNSIARKGKTDNDCCSPKYCRDFTCSSSKWTSRNLTADDTTLGSTFKECCDVVLCEAYTCTSDYDGDGSGTKFYKRRDTNSYKFQGSTDEECCYPKYCSQYETKFPSKWRRKRDADPATPILGSTDAECYDKILCSDFCGCEKGGGKPIPKANTTQGSTFEECCVAISP